MNAFNLDKNTIDNNQKIYRIIITKRVIKMKSLYDFKHLQEDTFYRCEHILRYIEKNRNLDALEKEAIQNTIMDSLVYFHDIDPSCSSLDLENMVIFDDVKHFCYKEYPDICGIPQFMKELFRTKEICVTGSMPISMFLAKPPSKQVRYCVFDPNTAVSAVFPYAKFYNVKYLSPTRGVYLKEDRPFVEVPIGKEMYLVDTLTKRIIKSTFFKENFGFDVSYAMDTRTLDKKRQEIYEEQIAPTNNYANTLFMKECIDKELGLINVDNLAEYFYEKEKSKQYFKDEWKKYYELQRDFEAFSLNLKKWF